MEDGSLIIGHDGKIHVIGRHADIRSIYEAATFDKEIDATGLSIVPGKLIDYPNTMAGGNMRAHDLFSAANLAI